MIDDRYIFDCEVFAFDWLFVFKHKTTKEYTVIHNDNEAVRQFMEQEPLLGGFNNKHYDQFILKAVLCDYTPEQVKAVNDFIIVQGHEGWEHPDLRESRVYFDQYDLMDDCQMTLTQWFSIPLRFIWALALSGSDAFMKPLPRNMTGLFNITKCRTITHGSAKKN